MKKLLLSSLLLFTSMQAMAHGYEYRGGYQHYEYHNNMGWVAPAIIGGVIGYQLNRPQIIYQQPQVIYQQPQVVYQQPSQIYVYPSGAPIPAGMICETKNDIVNNQQVINSYCHY